MLIDLDHEYILREITPCCSLLRLKSVSCSYIENMNEEEYCIRVHLDFPHIHVTTNTHHTHTLPDTLPLYNTSPFSPHPRLNTLTSIARPSHLPSQPPARAVSPPPHSHTLTSHTWPVSSPPLLALPPLPHRLS